MATRPTFPHLENLYRSPEILNGPVTITEKIHGFNARVGRDEDGKLWFGSRNQDFDAAVAPSLQGFSDWARGAFPEAEVLGLGVTLYGEWAGRGIMKGIDYGTPRFYLFGVRYGDGPVLNDRETITGFARTYATAHVPFLGEVTRPVIGVLDALRDEPSEIAMGSGREGIVVAPLLPFFDAHGHQVIGKHKSEAFRETASSPRVPRTPTDMTNALAFAAEYVTANRLEHVLQQVVEANPDCDCNGGLAVEVTGDVLRAMYNDVVREGGPDYEALDDVDKKILGKAVNKLTHALLATARTEALTEFLADQAEPTKEAAAS